MDGIISELVILMKKSTDLLEDMSLQKDPTSALANKNISNAAESSTFGKKESGDLTQSETKKANKIASIFISKFFEEQGRRSKDKTPVENKILSEKKSTLEKTSPLEKKTPVSKSIVEKIQKQIIPEKTPSKLLNTLVGLFKENKKTSIIDNVFISNFFKEQIRKTKEAVQKNELVDKKSTTSNRIASNDNKLPTTDKKVERIQKQITPEKTPNKLISNLLGMIGLFGETLSAGKKDSGELSGNETKKVHKIASIFISKFFDERDLRKKDTFEKTSLAVKTPIASGGKSEKTQTQQPTAEQSSGGFLGSLLETLGISAIFTKLTDRLKNSAKNAAKSVGKRIWNSLKKAISSVGNFFKNAFSKIGSSGVWKSFKTSLSKGGTSLKNLLTSAKDSVLKTVKSLGEFSKNAISKIPGVSKALPALKSVAGKAVSAATSATKTAASAISKQGGFLNALKSVGGKALSMAKTASGAVVSGAKAVGGAAVSGVKTVGKAAASVAVGPAKKAISSAVAGAVKSAGGAAKFLKVMKGVPLLGGIIETVLSYNDIKDLKAEYEAGKITVEDLQQRAGKRGIQGITGLIGTTAGAALGTALGSVVPVVGNLIGGVLGALTGDKVGKFLGGVIADNVIPEKYTKSVGAFLTNTPPPKEEMQDFIIRGKNVYPFSKKDDVMGMKSGGAIENFLGSSGNNSNIKQLGLIIRESNRYLQAIEFNTRNFAGGGSKQSSNKNTVTVIPSPPPSQSSPIVQFGNNRDGYASSVYTL
jgi:hypothetical protein